METSAFAKRLSAILEEKGMSRADLARSADIPYHRLNPWFIRHSAKPSSADLLAVSRLLGVSEQYLLEGGERQPFTSAEGLAQRAARLDADGQRELERYVDYLLARQGSSPQGQS